MKITQILLAKAKASATGKAKGKTAFGAGSKKPVAVVDKGSRDTRNEMIKGMLYAKVEEPMEGSVGEKRWPLKATSNKFKRFRSSPVWVPASLTETKAVNEASFNARQEAQHEVDTIERAWVVHKILEREKATAVIKGQFLAIRDAMSALKEQDAELFAAASVNPTEEEDYPVFPRRFRIFAEALSPYGPSWNSSLGPATTSSSSPS